MKQPAFDFKNPNYAPILQKRVERLAALRKDPDKVALLRVHYSTHPWDLINDWGVTFDPRNVGRKVVADDGVITRVPALVPFVLMPRQFEWCEWVYELFVKQEDGLCDKSRDVGMSWLAIGFACAMGVTNNDYIAGFGSRKEILVDKAGDPSCLFYKAEQFMTYLPREFRAGWTRDHRKHMQINFPDTQSKLTGEAGDNIGRGGRVTQEFIDESAFLERPMIVDAALSATTNCRIDLSSVNGLDNPFAEKRFNWPDHRIFTFGWRDDLRKDDVWYQKQKGRLNPIIVAQEIDLNYAASKEGQVIPPEWVQASLDACFKLGIKATGKKSSAYDVADEGKDKCAWGWRYGVELRDADMWSGKGSDTFDSTERCFRYCREASVLELIFDEDGLGAGVRGDARVLNSRPDNAANPISAVPFRGSSGVIDPEHKFIKNDEDPKGRTNADMFQNLKAQAWWSLRMRFQATYRAVVENIEYDPDEIISIPSTIRNRQKLMSELSQPLYTINTTGKIVINKAPEGTRSPNLADMVMMLYSPMPIEPLSVFDFL